MSKKVLLFIVLLAAAVASSYAVELHSILNTGDQATYIDTVKLKRTARPEVALPTQGFGGDPGVEDTFNFGPQSWPNEYIQISYIVGVARMTPYRINQPVEDQWYELPLPFPLLQAPKVKFVNVDGVAEEETASPEALALRVAPNPVQRRAVLRFEIPRTSRCLAQVFDAAGRVVRTLVDRTLDAGVHHLSWDRTRDAGGPAPAGAYVVRLSVGEHSRLAKLVVTD